MPDSRSSTGVPEARTVSASSLRSTSRGAGPARPLGLLVAKQAEHHPQLVLGGPADHLDRFQRGARLLGVLRHQTPAHPGLDGDHREGVGHDVVQLVSDAHPFLADLLAGAFCLRGLLALRLLSQPAR